MDDEITNSLKEYQQKNNLLESEEQRKKKEYALKLLKGLVKEWVRELLMSKKGMSEDLSQEIKVRICPYGSYKLGVSSKNSDIDTLLVVPLHIDRNDFFDSLSEKLKKHELVQNLQCIRTAFVPLMNFELDTIEVRNNKKIKQIKRNNKENKREIKENNKNFIFSNNKQTSNNSFDIKKFFFSSPFFFFFLFFLFFSFLQDRSYFRHFIDE